MAFPGSQDRVVDVEGVLQAFDDGKVDGVRSCGRRVLFGELVKESNEYGMPLDLSLKRLGLVGLNRAKWEIPSPTAEQALPTVSERTGSPVGPFRVRYMLAKMRM